MQLTIRTYVSEKCPSSYGTNVSRRFRLKQRTPFDLRSLPESLPTAIRFINRVIVGVETVQSLRACEFIRSSSRARSRNVAALRVSPVQVTVEVQRQDTGARTIPTI